MSVREAAAVLGIEGSEVWKLCVSGELPHSRAGLAWGSYRIERADLDAYLASTGRGSLALMSRGKERPAAGSVSIRVAPEYRDWLDRLAEFKRLTLVDVIDQALVKYARDEGFDEVAPKR
jgi:excisionase family DNA binding protein